MKLSEKFADENMIELQNRVSAINNLLLELCKFTESVGIARNTELLLEYSPNARKESGGYYFPHNYKCLDIEFTNRLEDVE